MTQDIKDMNTSPELTLDPFKKVAPPEAQAPAVKEETAMDETVLSEEERKIPLHHFPLQKGHWQTYR